MKRIFFWIIISCLPGMLLAEMLEPVKWKHRLEKKGDFDYQLIFEATIDKGWYLYSQHIDGDDGPIPTAIHFEDSSMLVIDQQASETGEKVIEKKDPMFNDMVIKKFSGTATFIQSFSVKEGTDSITGYLEFMTCDDEKCLFPSPLEFDYPLQDQSSGASAISDSEDPEAQPDEDQNNQGLLDPVKWTLKAEKINDQELTLVFTATVDKGWYVYSQFVAEGGPIPTTFHFEDSSLVDIQARATETGDKEIEKEDPLFENIVVRKFAGTAVFRQTIKAHDPSTPIKGYMEYMTCDHMQCLFPSPIDFVVEPAAGKAYFAGEDVILPPDTKTSEFKAPPAGTCADEYEESSEGQSAMMIFLLGFLGGLVALLTPCVFPMIPLTVSFFTKKGDNKGKGIRDALLYGFCIVLIYFLLSVPFLLFDLDPDMLNAISTNVWLNLLFFVVFVVFAISFFGYFEITLPSNLANKADSASDIGGIMGIFFMALTLALVSFSCTGPILGSLLVGALSAEGGAVNLAVGMTGFGFALGLPFALFAAFPQWLNSLPKSGGWLNSVKVVLGFLELGLALKFLSNADLVEHWGLLKREIFFGIWVLIGLGLTLYLFGKIRFPHDSKMEKLPAARLVLGLVVLGFTLYISPGITNTKYANVSLVSGFPPPIFYSIFDKNKLYQDNAIRELYYEGKIYYQNKKELTEKATGRSVEGDEKEKVLKHFEECPLGLPCYHDFEEAREYAQLSNKPIMIDFTGWACVNCRKMEENVWPETPVYKRLNDDYVLVSLYVDDKKKLPADVDLKSRLTGKKIRTIGEKWSEFQAFNFNYNTQPFYVLLRPDNQMLNHGVGYMPNVQEYVDYLECGLQVLEEMPPNPVVSK